MRWSAAKLRWVSLGGALLLAGVLAGFLGLARYRAGKIWQRILSRNGINLHQDTNGFTYSQSSGGRTVFTVHASKATPEGKNKWTLHDAVLILYGQRPGREDRIYGKQFEYDQSEGVARAVGEVHMDLQAPEPAGKADAEGSRPELSFGPEDETDVDPGVIHVRTSGLVYMRKLGIAATGETAEFRYGGMMCVSHGAEFDSGPSVVRLLADVRLTGTLREAPFTLTAAHAELNREANTADLTGAVWATADRSARAGRALLHLHKDGSLAAGDASGDVEARAGTQRIAAPQVAAVFGAANRVERARWFTGVRFADTDRSRPAEGFARALDVQWTPEGALNVATATGVVHYAARGTAGDGAAVSRGMRAEQAVASFAAGEGAGGKTSMLREVHMTGGAEIHSSAGSPDHGGRATATDVYGDELISAFGMESSGTAQIRQLHGAGHTQLEQTAADGARQRSQGETLDVTFAPGTTDRGAPVQVVSAVQTGHVEVQSWAPPKPPPPPGLAPTALGAGELTTGRAGTAVFANADGTLTLEGSAGERASVEGKQGVLAGAHIVLHQGSGDAEASGGVDATDWAESGSRTGSPATHVQASRARLLHAAGISEFFGDARRPAQMWQGGSQVSAAEITLDGRTKNISATPDGTGGVVQAVFAAAEGRVEKENAAHPGDSAKGGTDAGPSAAGPSAVGKVPEAGRSAVRVSATRMDYDDAHRQAVFTGGVRMRGAMGEASADRGNAFLRVRASPRTGGQASGMAPGLSGALDRMVLLGSVRLMEPGRTGMGEQMTYTAATDSFVLTGTAARPPRVTGEQGSVVTGATLLFRSGESTIVVAGAKSSPGAAGPPRVHTETDLKP